MGSRNVKSRMLYWKISHDQRVNVLSGPWPMLLYTWLIPCQDNLGRLEGDADVIKGMVFPKQKSATERQVESWLQALHGAGLVYRYHLNGAWYLQFPSDSVERHQKIVGNMTDTSEFPPPNPSAYDEWNHGVRASINVAELEDTCSLEGKGSRREVEGKGSRREGNLYRERFNVFWDCWPKRRRVGKSEALQAWLDLRPDESLCKVILEAVKIQQSSRQWMEEGGKYIPHPHRWLRKRRWEDEVPPSAPTTHKGLQALQRVDSAMKAA